MGEGALASMTAFASAEGAADGVSWSWDLRSVNGRGLDLRLRLPDGLTALEQPLRAALQKALTRGNVTLGLRVNRVASAGGQLSSEALDAALELISEVEARANGGLTHSTAVDVLNMRGVMDGADAMAMPDTEVLMAEAQELIAAFVAMRRTEGAALARVMSEQLDQIAALTRAARSAAQARTEAQGNRLRAQVAALLAETEIVDEARLAQEIAVLAVKGDVMEEIDRLRAHVDAARDLLDQGGPVGRKLDFLMQEFNREANTLCAKSGDTALTAIGLDLKLTIDQMREQVQNVE
ncbi:YicC/YloC family endoribonuclease [Gymnodinialimonas ceratoperidinii]|uniref:YicC family protein n=1 Tax=Gymnodinialimonas ceratoperidinii TaxID=2856823 RepID=A0A8F6TTM0_9RHOB|nr:YicC/YloC family endoribonuclease [Gymnodinialimonas ceratoperidinii]QXT38460.1 YicC family protein [Gymnodinialimonas ceratoperidinii]